ncbi:MAG: SirB2 family protein [Gammaproteobacteria bacterium]|jgi:uncharacterized membrane protein SirB2|nr:SirB2 family protein [Gammaproteobacteria bacterium]
MHYYYLLKVIHVSAAMLSIALFCLRLYWSVNGSALLQRAWVKVMPHVIDSVLLLAGVSLMLLLRAWPQQQPWLAAKLVGLLIYIVLGSIAIKYGRTARIRLLAGSAAIVVFVFIVGAAWMHSPLSWLA